MILVVIQTLSTERFATYLTAAGHDQSRAMQLYLWNAQIGEAFHTPIQACEVALRNGVNRALVARFGVDWWRDPYFLSLIDRERQKDLELVQKRIKKRSLSLVTGQIVAGLSFGFWVGLLSPRYNPAIWGRYLRVSFPSLPAHVNRDALQKEVFEISTFRNRISHHEPIFKRDILSDFSRILGVLKWVCPATHDWIKPHCRVSLLVRQKP